MRDQLRLMREEARDLTAVEGMNAARITGLKRYTDEFLEEASALFTILSGRLYAASYYLFDEGTDRLPVPLDLDVIDSTLTEFRRFDDAFRQSTTPELTVVIKGVQAARSPPARARPRRCATVARSVARRSRPETAGGLSERRARVAVSECRVTKSREQRSGATGGACAVAR